jgi:uncharacterized integral membrane protein (TIGR00698 family)
MIAVCAQFLGEHYGGPPMLFALLMGMAFNFLAEDVNCAAGIAFAGRTLLRLGVALLGLRIVLADILSLGAVAYLAVCGFVLLTILVGILLARLVGRTWHYGVLTGGAVAICGASAALSLAAVLPRGQISERDTLFVVVGVTTLSTVAMVLYPVLFAALHLDHTQIGFLIGATIHDVAQVVGAGFSVSDTSGHVATIVKLQRVALLPVVLLAVSFAQTTSETRGAGLPWFLVAFLVFAVLSSLGFVPAPVSALAAEASRWLLLIAISALGVRTSLGKVFEVGSRSVYLMVAETVFLLLCALAFVFVAG